MQSLHIPPSPTHPLNVAHDHRTFIVPRRVVRKDQNDAHIDKYLEIKNYDQRILKTFRQKRELRIGPRPTAIIGNQIINGVLHQLPKELNLGGYNHMKERILGLTKDWVPSTKMVVPVM